MGACTAVGVEGRGAQARAQDHPRRHRQTAEAAEAEVTTTNGHEFTRMPRSCVQLDKPESGLSLIPSAQSRLAWLCFVFIGVHSWLKDLAAGLPTVKH